MDEVYVEGRKGKGKDRRSGERRRGKGSGDELLDFESLDNGRDE